MFTSYAAPTPYTLTFSRIAKKAKDADCLFMTDQDETLGIFEPGNYGKAVINQAEINTLGNLLRSKKTPATWVVGNTSRPATSIGVWTPFLQQFPMSQIVLDQGKLAFTNPKSHAAGAWLKQVQDHANQVKGAKSVKGDQKWRTHIQKTYGWDAAKIKALYHDFLRETHAVVTDANHVIGGTKTVKEVAFYSNKFPRVLNEKKVLMNREQDQSPLPYVADLAEEFDNAVINFVIPDIMDENPAQVKETKSKINTYLDHLTKAFPEKIDAKFRNHYEMSIHPWAGEDGLWRWFVGPQLKSITKATYIQHQLKNGALKPKRIIVGGDSWNDDALLFSIYANKKGKAIPTYPILRVHHVADHAVMNEDDKNYVLIQKIKHHHHGIFVVSPALQDRFMDQYGVPKERVFSNYPEAVKFQMTRKKSE